MTDFRALCAELLHELDLWSSWHDAPELKARAKAALTQPEPQGPTDEKLTLVYAYAVAAAVGNKRGPFKTEEAEAAQLAGLRAVLARWGRPAIEPVPVAERLPGPEDCTTNPRTGQGQWCWGWVQHDDPPYSGRWRMMRREWLADEAVAWLPHHALPVPQQGK
jgi:hypothetical protein